MLPHPALARANGLAALTRTEDEPRLGAPELPALGRFLTLRAQRLGYA